MTGHQFKKFTRGQLIASAKNYNRINRRRLSSFRGRLHGIPQYHLVPGGELDAVIKEAGFEGPPTEVIHQLGGWDMNLKEFLALLREKGSPSGTITHEATEKTTDPGTAGPQTGTADQEHGIPAPGG